MSRCDLDLSLLDLEQYVLDRVSLDKTMYQILSEIYQSAID